MQPTEIPPALALQEACRLLGEALVRESGYKQLLDQAQARETVQRVDDIDDATTVIAIRDDDDRLAVAIGLDGRFYRGPGTVDLASLQSSPMSSWSVKGADDGGG